MPTAIRVLRKVMPVPSADDMTFAARGFTVPDTAAARRLEGVPRAVMFGFDQAADARTDDEIVRRLVPVDEDFRGLAYEGATVALIVRDMLTPRRSHRALTFVQGPAAPDIFMAYIGYGFLMSHLPRWTWERRLPAFGGPPSTPDLSWLAVDGYGFDRAYLDTARWVDRQEQPRPFTWRGAPDYFPRAFDQGIGRALWFINGGDTVAVAAAITRFPAERRADLWSGTGSAVTFVGGAEPDQVSKLLADAAGWGPDLAQGAAMSVKARAHSGLVPGYTAMAADRLCGMSVDAAVRLIDDAGHAIYSGAGDRTPGYQQWRTKIRQYFDERSRTSSR